LERSITLSDSFFGNSAQINGLSLDLDIDMVFEDWEAVGEILKGMALASPWLLGDWLVFGEGRYSDIYAQALDDLDAQTIKGYVWVAEKVPPANRKATLSWSHHRAVAGLPADQQSQWLQKAGDNSWSVSELKRQIKGEAPPAKIAEALSVRLPVQLLSNFEDRLTIRLESDDIDGLHDAIEAEEEYEIILEVTDVDILFVRPTHEVAD
jgi:hypothetical protein